MDQRLEESSTIAPCLTAPASQLLSVAFPKAVITKQGKVMISVPDPVVFFSVSVVLRAFY